MHAEGPHEQHQMSPIQPVASPSHLYKPILPLYVHLTPPSLSLYIFTRENNHPINRTHTNKLGGLGHTLGLDDGLCALLLGVLHRELRSLRLLLRCRVYVENEAAVRDVCRVVECMRKRNSVVKDASNVLEPIADIKLWLEMYAV